MTSDKVNWIRLGGFFRNGDAGMCNYGMRCTDVLMPFSGMLHPASASAIAVAVTDRVEGVKQL